MSGAVRPGTGPEPDGVDAGTVVVVTGGARGIGASLCRDLARRGAAVVVADVVDGTPLTDELGAAGQDVVRWRPT